MGLDKSACANQSQKLLESAFRKNYRCTILDQDCSPEGAFC